MIVVTGGAGFIGSALVWALNQEGLYDILIVDKLGKGEKWKNLTNLIFTDYMSKEQFLTEIANNTLTFKIKTLFHMGACSSTTENNADYLMENNVEYTKKLAEWCAANQTPFIYASSAATYGNGSNGYSDSAEELQNLKPLNMYGYSKHFFDLWAKKHGYFNKIIGLKFFNVFGPNEYHKKEMRSLIHKIFPLVQKGEKIKLFKSHKEEIAHGEQKRDFIYIKDVVKILIFFFNNYKPGLYNVGTGNAHTFKELAEATFNACKRKKRIAYIDMPINLREKYQYYTCADNHKLRSAGYKEPFTPFAEGIQDYIRNYLSKQDPYLGNNIQPIIKPIH